MSKKVAAAGGVTKRKTHKYAELEGEEIDEQTINDVLGKTKFKGKQKSALDGVSNDDELTEKQVE